MPLRTAHRTPRTPRPATTPAHPGAGSLPPRDDQPAGRAARHRQGLEPLRVDALRVHCREVSGTARDHQRTITRQRAPQARGAMRLHRPLRPCGPPKTGVIADTENTTTRGGQQRQQRSLLPARHVDPAQAVPDPSGPRTSNVYVASVDALCARRGLAHRVLDPSVLRSRPLRKACREICRRAGAGTSGIAAYHLLRSSCR